MKIRSAGLDFLTTPEEQQEIRAVGTVGLKLKYHKGSERMGKPYGIDCRIWDVLSPQVPGYNYDRNSGPVTLSLQGMKDRGLLK